MGLNDFNYPVPVLEWSTSPEMGGSSDLRLTNFLLCNQGEIGR